MSGRCAGLLEKIAVRLTTVPSREVTKTKPLGWLKRRGAKLL